MLHIISNLPLSPSFLENTHSGDTVIFTDNAIVALKQSNAESFAQKAFSHINLCVRKADLIIKNISNTDLLRGVAIIDESQFENATSEYFAVRSSN